MDAAIEEGAPLQWMLTAHACRVCFGRVLVRETFDRRKVYRCANCEVEREGKNELAICACGITLKTKIDAGLRCTLNEKPTPEFPSRVIVEQPGVSNMIK